MAKGGAIYLGNDAEIEFERRSLKTHGILKRENISTSSNRWSLDFADSILQTGDRVRITRTDKNSSGGYKNLILGDNQSSNSWEFFVYVDFLGRISTYNTLLNALNNQGANSLALTQGSTNDWEQPTSGDYFQNIDIEVIEQGFRPFAKCNDYQLTTSKDTIDVTTLGEHFYKQYENGLIGGQGTVTAIWDEKALTPGDNECGDPYVQSAGDELSAYFAKLILRIQIGAGFRGRFYLRKRDPERQPESDRWAVFWQADCVCTNVAVQAVPDQMIQTRIEFVTTGLFQLEVLNQGEPQPLTTEDDLLLEREGSAGLILTN